jgi:hypothetical protein
MSTSRPTFYSPNFINTDGSYKMNRYPNDFVFLLEGCIFNKKTMSICQPYPILSLSRLEYYQVIDQIFTKARDMNMQMIPLFPLVPIDQQTFYQKDRNVVVYNPKYIGSFLSWIQLHRMNPQTSLEDLHQYCASLLCEGFTPKEAYGQIIRKIIISKSRISFYDVGIELDKSILFQKADRYWKTHPTLKDAPYMSKLHILKKEYPKQWKQLKKVTQQILDTATIILRSLESKTKERRQIYKKVLELSKRFYFDPLCLFLNPQMTYEQIIEMKKKNPNFLKGMPFLTPAFGIDV